MFWYFSFVPRGTVMALTRAALLPAFKGGDGGSRHAGCELARLAEG